MTTATDKLIVKDEMTGMFACTECGKNYAKLGTLINHLDKKHPEAIEAAQAEIDEKSFENKIRYVHTELFTYVPRRMKDAQKEIDEAKDKLDRYGVEDFFTWRAEPMVLADCRLKLLQEIQMVVENSSDLKEMFCELTSMKDEWTTEIIERFPRHNSTSELSNIYDRLKMQAKAEIVSDRFGSGSLPMVIHYADQLTDIMEKY